MFINPFLNEKQMKEFLLIRKDIAKVKEKNHNIKYTMFEKFTDFTKLSEFIAKSISNNRIPMILSSKQFIILATFLFIRLLLTKNDFMDKYKQIS